MKDPTNEQPIYWLDNLEKELGQGPAFDAIVYLRKELDAEKLELKILTRAYNELFKLHYRYEPDTKEVVGYVSRTKP